MACVTVSAPARLHLGFFDLNGELGRRFGSLGLAISDIETRLSVRQDVTENGARTDGEYKRATRAAARLCEELAVAISPNIEIHQHIPPHAGLGSGTQMALAVGRAITTLQGISLSTAEIAAINQRGARSGIGIGVFEQGGFVVDLGRGPDTTVPPQLCRLDFPNWPIILLSDGAIEGISGTAEKQAFQDLGPMNSAVAAALCRYTLMGVIPAVIERDFSRFAQSLRFIQQTIGDYFAPFQRGHRFTSESVGQVALAVEQRWPQTVIGQSSWGPTGFVFCPTESLAASIKSAFESGALAAGLNDNVVLSVHRARNVGASINRINSET